MSSVYVEFLKKSFQQRYVYRANSYFYILSSLFTLFIQISIWSALYSKKSVIDGISFKDMVNYVIINMLVLSLTKSNIGNKMANKVRDGSIAADFIRPISIKHYFISEQLGENCFHTLFNTLPVCIFSAVFLKFGITLNFFILVLFIISVINGVVLIYYINYTFGLLAFWFKNSLYVNWFLGAFFSLFGGTFVPLWFYPSLLYKMSKVLPFRLVSFEPISIYLGKLSTVESVKVIVVQFLWIILLMIIEKFIWKKAQMLITVQGG